MWCSIFIVWLLNCFWIMMIFKSCFGFNLLGMFLGKMLLLLDCLKGIYGVDCVYWSVVYLNGCSYYQFG